MRNSENRSKIIIGLAKRLPVFRFDDLTGTEKDRHYLWLILHRYQKTGELIRLKKGIYTTGYYVEKIKNQGTIEIYTDFLANFLYQPSYLSLETILYRHNILTEIPANLTSMTKNKTAALNNRLGNFLYHKIKPSLFCGFELHTENNLTIMKATKAKALFDFLYLRKNILPTPKAIQALRLDREQLSRSDLAELRKYVKLEGSSKMWEISNYFFNK